MSELMDIKGGLARVGNNEGLFKRLLAKFEASVDMEGFESALAEKDYLKAGEIVHAAKGIAGNLSLTALFDISSVLMEELRGGAAPVDEDVVKFKEKFEETKVAVNEYLG